MMKVKTLIEFGKYYIERHNEKHAVISSIEGGDVEVNPSFYEMQHIKSIAFGGRAVAVEVFPDQTELVDGQNHRHLWLMEKEAVPNLKTGERTGEVT